MLRFVLGILLALGLTACKKSSTSSGGVLTLAGSTSVQPFAEKWAEVYMQKHPGLQINVQGGGSTSGVRAAQSGAAQVGMVSRDLKPDENDLKPLVVARDGIAVVVSPMNPINGMTIDVVRSIFSGTTTNWKSLGGADHPITIITREEGSGTRTAFEELVMKKAEISRSALVQDSTGAVREMVRSDKNAIGYISVGQVNEQVKALPLGGIAATEEGVVKGQYPLVRPFAFVLKGEPMGAAKDFIQFVLSSEGQELVRKEGLIPVK